MEIIPANNYARVIGEVKDGAAHPEILVDKISNVSSSKELIFILSLLLLQEDCFLDIRDLDSSFRRFCGPRITSLKIWVDPS